MSFINNYFRGINGQITWEFVKESASELYEAIKGNPGKAGLSLMGTIIGYQTIHPSIAAAQDFVQPRDGIIQQYAQQAVDFGFSEPFSHVCDILMHYSGVKIMKDGLKQGIIEVTVGDINKNGRYDGKDDIWLNAEYFKRNQSGRLLYVDEGFAVEGKGHRRVYETTTDSEGNIKIDPRNPIENQWLVEPTEIKQRLEGMLSDSTSVVPLSNEELREMHPEYPNVQIFTNPIPLKSLK